VLPRISESKDDAAEEHIAGQSFSDLSPNQLPPCLSERANFMAPFPITLSKRHPYVNRNSESHGHFLPTPFTMRSYSAACLPYREVLDLALEQGVDPEQFLAFAPDDAFWSFSYGSEHVSHDEAIASVLNCLRALERIQGVLPGPWDQVSTWLDQQLNRLWRMRGPFPGFGSALTAFLGDRGNLIAYEIAGQCAQGSVDGNIDPWPAFERIVQTPDTASGILKDHIGEGFGRAWGSMTAERKALLKLLSRSSLSSDQVERFFNPDNRPTDVEDASLIENPYLLYELDRASVDAIPVTAIDRPPMIGSLYRVREVSGGFQAISTRQRTCRPVIYVACGYGRGEKLWPFQPCLSDRTTGYTPLMRQASCGARKRRRRYRRTLFRTNSSSPWSGSSEPINADEKPGVTIE